MGEYSCKLHLDINRLHGCLFLRTLAPSSLALSFFLTGSIAQDAAPMIPVRVAPAVVHLPDDPTTPLVMVGLGTGMAPFRAFIQQRKILAEQGEEVGPMLLYFGARFEKTEYLYGDEIDGYVHCGERLER